MVTINHTTTGRPVLAITETPLGQHSVKVENFEDLPPLEFNEMEVPIKILFSSFEALEKNAFSYYKTYIYLKAFLQKDVFYLTRLQSGFPIKKPDL